MRHRMMAMSAVAAAGLLVGQCAIAAPTAGLQITTGGLTATILDNGACVGTGCGSISADLNVAVGTDLISGSINGWTINVVSGTSHTPGLVPFGIDVSSLTAGCSTASCTGANDLHVIFSDIGFNAVWPPITLDTDYSATINGSGSTSESAYYSNTDALFAETHLIGTVGPFTATNHGSAFDSSHNQTAPYSLTLDQVFSAGANCATGGCSFSVDGDISGVPEPASVSLLGGVLLFAVGMIRRKVRKA